MNARITAIGIVAAIFSLISLVMYIIAVTGMSNNSALMQERIDLKQNMTRLKIGSKDYL
jgi:hypothetical protein